MKPARDWNSQKVALAALSLVLALALGACDGSAPSSTTGAAIAPVDLIISSDGRRQSGFIPLPDGAQLKYTLLLPAAEGKFPLIVEYDGYGAGSASSAPNGFLERGYAYLGLNIRGTGCSTGGPWDVFSPQWGRDGAFAVEWAAQQPWSTGKVGMWGVSFGGYMQLWVAAFRPRGLAVIVPGAVVTDILRDVPQPGGVPNVLFPVVWWSILNQTWLAAGVDGTSQGHAACREIAAANIRDNQSRSIVDTMLEMTHESAFTLERSANRYTHAIEVPTLGIESWQDEQVSPRGGFYEDTMDPNLIWMVGANGGHGNYVSLPAFQELAYRFYDHYLKGEDNGAERTPHFQIWNETGTDGVAAWTTAFPQWPVPMEPMRWYLREGGQLGDQPPAAAESADRYAYPVPGPAVLYPIGAVGSVAIVSAWSGPADPAGTAAYTSPPLTEDLSFYGPASADLWVSSTAMDTDMQVTLTEVRPDGMEMYVQRGWLRASQRALTPERSTELRPFHTQTVESQRPLTPGIPELLRVELLKFAHTFRKGSRIRLLIDTPSPTGLWAFAITPTAGDNTIWHDPEHPSSLVLGLLKGQVAGQPLPACESLQSQPCRPETLGAQ